MKNWRKMTKNNVFKNEKSLSEVTTTQMYNFLFNTVWEASKIILKARWRYQKHSTKFGGYIGKKIWIVRHLEMKNWRKMTKNNAYQHEKSLLEVLTTQKNKNKKYHSFGYHLHSQKLQNYLFKNRLKRIKNHFEGTLKISKTFY